MCQEVLTRIVIGQRIMFLPREKWGRLGCIAILLLGLLLVLSVLRYFRSTVRVPREIPLGALLEMQAEALGPDWTVDTHGSIFTDTDFTSGVWTFWTSLDSPNRQYDATLEFHVFQRPDLAKARLSPSPMAVNVDKNGDLPTNWSYVPPHADRFVLDCTDEPIPEGCYGLLVYQEYSLVFAIDVAGAASLEDVQRFIEATDAFMYDFLSTTKLEAGRRQVPSPSQLGLPDGTEVYR